MGRRIKLSSVSSFKAAGGCALSTLALVAVSYRLPASLEVDFGSGLASALASRNFYDAEEGYRWSRTRSEIVFRDPGATSKARIELLVSGFRPPGEPPPLLWIETGQDRLRLRASPRAELVAFDTRTTGSWSSDLEVRLRSETFTPGGGDARALGVRVHRARLILDEGALPPARQLFSSVSAVLLLFGLVVSTRREKTVAMTASMSLAVLLAAGYALFRVYTTTLAPWLFLALGAAALLRAFLPSVTRFAARAAGTAVRAVLDGLSGLLFWPAAALALAALIGTLGAYRWSPYLAIDLGSGAAEPIARRFAGPDQDGGVRFRQALAGASLDLRDFGTSSPWNIEITASIAGTGESPVRGVVARAGGHELTAELTEQWRRLAFEVPAPSPSWSGGHVLSFPGIGRGAKLRIASVRVDRARSLPSLQPLSWIVGFVLLWLAVLKACGLSVERAALAAGVLLAILLVALIAAPVVSTPLLFAAVLASAASLLLAAASRGLLEASAALGLLPRISPEALAVACVGFLGWFLATASPLYAGGHFGFHTAISEEIWQGKFLLYYLPYPGSMLSRQPQWANLIVPHSCLYHTLAAPFAAFPRFWFHTLTKLFLAALLFGIALTAALVGSRIGGGRTGAYAAFVAVAAPTGFQLLGLGHLMTLFGTWAAAVALGFLIAGIRRSSERAVWWLAMALLTLCFLSYTGSLVFASTSLVAAGTLLSRREPALAMRLASILGTSWALSFLLYYAYWSLPFLRETLPALLSGAGSDTSIDFTSRLAALPGKLNYTFGSPLLPVVGLVGIALAPVRTERLLLYCWAGVLIAFSFLDLVFNFLLKHHYFSYPAIAIGAGVAFDWLGRKGLRGRAILGFFFVLILVTGFFEALRVASGGA